MKSKSKNFEVGKERTFDCYCKKILKHEARNQYAAIKRRRNYEVSLSELSEAELAALYTTDEYFADERIFRVGDYDVPIHSEEIASALMRLPKRKCDIVLLSYFLDLSDRQIGEKLDMIRATVQYQRTKALRELKKFMEETNEEE